MSALVTPGGSVNCAEMSSAVCFHVYAGMVAPGEDENRVDYQGRTMVLRTGFVHR